MLACYWADFDPSANPHSNVYARVVGDTRTWTDGRNILRKAHGPNVQFDATSPTKVMVIATWLNVTYSGGDATTPVLFILHIRERVINIKLTDKYFVSDFDSSVRHNERWNS